MECDGAYLYPWNQGSEAIIPWGGKVNNLGFIATQNLEEQKANRGNRKRREGRWERSEEELGREGEGKGGKRKKTEGRQGTGEEMEERSLGGERERWEFYNKPRKGLSPKSL